MDEKPGDLAVDAWIGRKVGEFLYRHQRMREHETDESEADMVKDLAVHLSTWQHPMQRWILAWVAIISLDRQDQCAVLDALYGALQPMKPVQAQWELQADAQAWAGSMPQDVLRVFSYEIWSEMNDERQNDLLKNVLTGLSRDRLMRVHAFSKRLLDKKPENADA